LLKRQKQNKAM